MNPVVHFEMPAEDRKRMSNFYTKAFGWQTQQLGPDMGDYVVVTTTESDDGDVPPKAAIKGLNTMLIAPRGAAISPEHQEIFVIDKVQNGIFAFSWQKILDELQR